MSQPVQPFTTALFEFYRYVNETSEEFGEGLLPVLRGSLLMQHWFGDQAREAADLDLECFEIEGAVSEVEQEVEPWGDGYGTYGEYETLVDLGKAMCRYAALSTQYYHWQRDSNPPGIEFYEIDQPPADGASLWVYGTPGERYYCGWRINAQGLWQKLTTKPIQGQLQIDIAAAGSYGLEQVGVAKTQLNGFDNRPYEATTYTQAMMLAAKLSWLLRSFSRTSDSPRDTVVWNGEPKDLFDIHLLLTAGEIPADEFQRCLGLVGIDDELDWGQISVLMQAAETMNDREFSNWDRFARQHDGKVALGPADMLTVVMERLLPMLGEFHHPAADPFVQVIRQSPLAESNYLLYADWLDEQGHPACRFLRLYRNLLFDRTLDSEPARLANTKQLREELRTVSRPWLHHFAGSGQAVREMMARIEADAESP